MSWCWMLLLWGGYGDWELGNVRVCVIFAMVWCLFGEGVLYLVLSLQDFFSGSVWLGWAFAFRS